MHGGLTNVPSPVTGRQRRVSKEDLQNRLKGVISVIPIDKVNERERVHKDLQRITSLEVSGASTETAHGKKPTLDEIIQEMEEEYERLLNGF